MILPSATHVVCLPLAAMPQSLTLPTSSQTSAPGCAFCGGFTWELSQTPSARRARGSCGVPHSMASRRRVRCTSSAAAAPIRPPQTRPTSPRPPGLGPASADLFVVAAGRWDDSAEDGRRGGAGTDGGGSRRRKMAGRASWEDIQWKNVPADRSRSTAGRTGADSEFEEEWEDEESEDLGLEPERPGARRASKFSRDRDWFDEKRGYDYNDQLRLPRRRDRAPARRTNGGDQVEQATAWNSGRFRDAERANQGGLFEWARGFYNALFWYGAATEELEQLPAINFTDLMQRFDVVADSQAPGAARPIVPPEDLRAEQEYRWRSSRRDSVPDRPARSTRADSRGRGVGAAAARRPPTPRKGRVARAWQEQERRPVPIGADRPQQRGRDFQGREDEAAAIWQLRRKQRQLADREMNVESDLEKVRERLSVVDATVELWLRRSQAMSARGTMETDTEMLQAKRRIYGLKDEGKQLDSARADLEERLQGCRAKLDLVVQELESLGEDAVPYVEYQPADEAATADTTAAGEVVVTAELEGDLGMNEDPNVEVGAKVELVDNLGLATEIKDQEREAVAAPVTSEAEK